MTHTSTHDTPIRANVTTTLETDRVHRLVVQMGSRSSVDWRAVGHVVQTEDGLFATFGDDNFQQVWDHWCAPRPGAIESVAVMRFAALDGLRPVHIATVRVPQSLINQLRHGQHLERALATHAPATGRHLPGGPGRMGSMWPRVERCMYEKRSTRAKR